MLILVAVGLQIRLSSLTTHYSLLWKKSVIVRNKVVFFLPNPKKIRNFAKEL